MAIDHVADRIEIQHLASIYVEAMDNSDFETLENVFTQDCVLDFTSAGGIRDTWPNVKKWWSGRHDVYVHFFHLFLNPVMVFTSDDRAEVRWKVYNPCGVVGTDGKVHDWVNHGHYTDVYRNTPDGWRVSERTWHDGWKVGDYPFTKPQGVVGTGTEA